MATYLIILFSLVIPGVLLYPNNSEIRILSFSGKKIEGQTLYCIIVAAIIIIIAGMRSVTVGSDTQRYYIQYTETSLFFNEFYEDYVLFIKTGILNFFSTKNKSLFYFLCTFFHDIGLSFNVFLLLDAAVYVIPIFGLIKQDSLSPWKSVFWFMVFSFSLSLTGVRIILAMGLTTIAFIALRKHKKIVSIVFGVLAILIHLSAVAFLVVYLFDKIKITKKSLYYLLPVFILVPIIGKYITPIILRYTYYNSIDMDNMTWNLSIYLFFSITTILLVYFSYENNSEYTKMMIIGTIICGFINYGALVNTYKYFTQYLCIALPGLTHNYKNHLLRIAFEIAYFGAGIYLFTRTFSPNSRYVPYLFFWQ